MVFNPASLDVLGPAGSRTSCNIIPRAKSDSVATQPLVGECFSRTSCWTDSDMAGLERKTIPRVSISSNDSTWVCDPRLPR